MKLRILFGKSLTLLAILATSFVFNSRAQTINGFEDIVLWSGAGVTATNRAAMVIQWNFGSDPDYTSRSLVWGFGWNSGAPTGMEMLTAVAAADSRLSLVFHPDFPSALFGVYYDAVNDGSGFTAGAPMDAGGSEDGSANNPSNYYQSGWFTGFWGYSIFGGDLEYDVFGGPPDYDYLGTETYDQPGSTQFGDVVWISPGIGAGSRLLANGYWDAWNFGPSFVNVELVSPVAAVPEPAVVFIVMIGLVIILLIARRQRVSSQGGR